MKYKFIDLFAGIGGFRIALEDLGCECVYTSEWNKHSKITYQANFNTEPDGDITKVDEKIIPKHDILCAGFPCQAFSVSGKRKGFNDTRGTLFFDVARITKHHKPKILFLENVKNFAKHDNGKTLEVVKTTLEEIGYNFYYKVINASHFGAVTSRERVYMIAIRKDVDMNTFDFPIGSSKFNILEDIVEKEFAGKKCNKEIIYKKSKDQINNLNPINKPIQIAYVNKGGQGERIYSTKGHAITLSAHGGGYFSKTGGYLINGKVRRLTPRECAIVMGFPKSYKIPVSDSQAYTQFGNSVAIPVLRQIGSNIIKSLKIWENTQHKKGQKLQKQVLRMSKV